MNFVARAGKWWSSNSWICYWCSSGVCVIRRCPNCSSLKIKVCSNCLLSNDSLRNPKLKLYVDALDSKIFGFEFCGCRLRARSKIDKERFWLLLMCSFLCTFILWSFSKWTPSLFFKWKLKVFKTNKKIGVPLPTSIFERRVWTLQRFVNSRLRF